MSWTTEQVEQSLEHSAQTVQVLDALFTLGVFGLAVAGFWVGWNIMGEALQRMENRG